MDKGLHSLFHWFVRFIILMVIITSVLSLLPSCRNLPVEKPGMPLIYLDFNDNVSNTGLLQLSIRGDVNVSYTDGVSGYGLDLSASARYRKPVIAETSALNSLSDYHGVTILLWTMAETTDPYDYFILGQKDYLEETGSRGWSIGKSAHGSWTWWFSDGINEVTYHPTRLRQPINNNRWNQVGFSLDYTRKEARLFYNGVNIAVISLENIDLSSTGSPFYIGSDPLSSDLLMDTYNGKIDEVGVWSRVLTPVQVKALHAEHGGLSSDVIKRMPDSITFLTWNICLGGRRVGRFAGVQRVAEIIRESGADVVAIQELFGSGEILADNLGFYYYRRSPGVGILSRFPIGETYNVFRSRNIGVASIELPRNQQLIFCSVRLNELPNTRAYITSGPAIIDTIIAREMETRGTEARFILWELQSLLRNNKVTPVVMAGNFNSGSHLDWTATNKGNNHGLVVEFPVTRLIMDAGFVDSYREFYPDETISRGLTWPLNLKDGSRDRIDFIFYTGSKLQVVSSKIIDDHPLGFPSDHAAVISSFKLE